MTFENTAAERRRTSISAAIGKEPKLSEMSTPSDVMLAFNWYSYNADTGDAKKYTLQYIKKTFKGGEDAAKKLSVLKDWEFGATGWMARQLYHGNKLPKRFAERFDARMKDLAEKANKIIAPTTDAEAAQIKAPRVPRMFTALTSTMIAELDGMIDEVEKHSSKDIYAWLSKRNLSNEVLSELSRYYASYENELKANVRGGDEQVIEAYKKIPKKRVRSLVEFINLLMGALSRLKVNKKNVRKPRAKKIKTAQQLSKKLKYKQSDDTYKVTSIPPTDVINTLQLWVFNTKTRKLGVYNASDSAPLSIKGTTIQGYNEASSVQKKLRKPEKTLQDVLSGNKASLRKVMDGINAKSSLLTGRINSDTILLRSVK